MARLFTHFVSFRVTAKMYSQLIALQSTFTEPKWGDTFRWLLEQPVVQDLIKQRLAEGQDKRMGGADFAIAENDR